MIFQRALRMCGLCECECHDDKTVVHTNPCCMLCLICGESVVQWAQDGHEHQHKIDGEAGSPSCQHVWARKRIKEITRPARQGFNLSHLRICQLCEREELDPV